MNTYKVLVNGVLMGYYLAESVEDAFDVYARDAGYEDFADLLARLPGSSRDEIDVISDVAG